MNYCVHTILCESAGKNVTATQPIYYLYPMLTFDVLCTF